MIFLTLTFQHVFLSSLLAVIFDWIFSETKRYHPLIGFGNIANAVEKRLNGNGVNFIMKKWLGSLAWFICILPLVLIVLFFNYFEFSYLEKTSENNYLLLFLDAFVLYIVIGHQSLKQHALNIFNPLNKNNEHSLTNARKQIAMMVSRDTTQLSEQEISRATVESVLENGHDAVIASLFWYAVGGLPFAILHRLANTLDAMWGYKNKQFLYFGWCSAKMDDWLGWPSAKITAFLYSLQGIFNKRFVISLSNAKQQSQQYKSLNGGWVMAAGATVLDIKLGGLAVYEHHQTKSVILGQGETVVPNDILRSIQLVSNSVWLWIALLGIMALLEMFI